MALAVLGEHLFGVLFQPLQFYNDLPVILSQVTPGQAAEWSLPRCHPILAGYQGQGAVVATRWHGCHLAGLGLILLKAAKAPAAPPELLGRWELHRQELERALRSSQVNTPNSLSLFHTRAKA